MKLKNYILINEGFIKLIGEFTSYRIKPTIAFTLLKLIKELNQEKQNIEDGRNNLIKKYGEETEVEGKQQISIKNDDKVAIEAFSKEFNEILNLDFELSIENKIDMDCNEIFKHNKEKDAWEPVYLTIGEVVLLSEIINFV